MFHSSHRRSCSHLALFHCAPHVSLCFVPQRGLTVAPSAARTAPMHPLWTSGPGGAVVACRYMLYICLVCPAYGHMACHTAGPLTRQGCGRSPVCSAHGKRWRLLVERFTHCLIQCLTEPSAISVVAKRRFDSVGVGTGSQTVWVSCGAVLPHGVSLLHDDRRGQVATIYFLSLIHI